VNKFFVAKKFRGKKFGEKKFENFKKNLKIFLRENLILKKIFRKKNRKFRTIFLRIF